MSIKDWPGGTITDIPVEPSGNYEDSAASGVWTVDQVSNYVKQDRWPTPGNVDPGKYVEGVFSTYLYTGTGASLPIVNGIDLSGEGGLVWQKVRSSAGYRHFWFDTERTFNNYISSNTTDAQSSLAALSSFNSDGVTLTSDGNVNGSGIDSALWSFRKTEKFFDVVTYTGNGTAGRTVSHNLGSVPGVIIVKKTSSSSSSNWYVYHVSTGNAAHTLLNTTSGADTSSSGWNSTTPTATEFTLGANVQVNASGESFVAYLFASDAGGFGDDGSENIIKCGSYTGNGSADGPTINCGFEPQWLLIKNTSDGGNWVLMDAMRGMPVGDEATVLVPNANGAESSYANLWGVDLQATGFKVNVSQIQINESGGTMIYIAIRRPMKTPESGTEVFAPVNRTATAPTYNTGFVTDMQIMTLLTGFQNQLTDRLRGQKKLLTNATDAESAIGTEATYDWMTGVGDQDSASSNNIAWMFKRATGFFDVVAYSGSGSAPQNVTHNLTVTPELMIVKYRDGSTNWYVYHSALGNTKAGYLDSNTVPNTSAVFWNNTSPTATQFTLGSFPSGSGNYIAYLFATLAGVSKVGSYTGTAADLNVDCGFSAGARFILIKRTDSTGDWYVWDSVRGIVAGNDPYILLNSTAAEVTNTDYVDPLSSGFTVTSSASSTVNVSSGTYIFLAIA